MMEVLKNGIKIYYQQINTDDARHSYVFIHGTGANHTQVDPQFYHFAKNNNVLALDLRGHGFSDKPKDEYTIEKYAEDIIFIIEQLNIKNPILVGSSMGGNISVEIASLCPKLPKALILLDSGLLYPEHFLTVLNEVEQGLAQDNYRDFIKKVYLGGCLPTDKYQSIMLNILINTPQYVWHSTVSNMLRWDAEKAANAVKECTLPILYIAGTEIITDLERFKQLCPQLKIAQTIGAGHLISLEAADQVNSMIEQFVRVYVNRLTNSPIL